MPETVINLAASQCRHCATVGVWSSGFCCAGCATVYRILHAKGLDRYYELKTATPSFSPALPVRVTDDRYEWWDTPTFREQYTDDGEIVLFLEGIHCLACLWVIEALPEWCEGILSSRLDVGRSIARIKVTSDFFLSRLANELSSIGYVPHPIARGSSAEKVARMANRRELVRLGIAGFAAGNIMLFSIPLYCGVTGSVEVLFRWISGFLFFPVLFYGLAPFTRAAALSVRKRQIPIDLPIAGAAWIAALASYSHLLLGGEALYFDSLSALVFLLLASRYVLRRAQWVASEDNGLYSIVGTSHVKRFQNGKFEEVPLQSVELGDRLEIPREGTCPADGILCTATAEIDSSILTGESIPEVIHKGELIHAGTVNRGGSYLIDVTATGPQTRIGRIVDAARDAGKARPHIVLQSERVARLFTFGVLALATGLILVRAGGSFETALSRALALLVVSCPCAFALAVPLTLTLALRRAASLGILIKDADTLEKLTKAKHVFLDKTGTLTTGRLEVVHWNWLQNEERDKPIVAWLESRSRHPIARAIRESLTEETPPTELPAGYQEITGRGIQAEVDNARYEIRGLEASNCLLETAIGVYRNQQLVATATFRDSIREESHKAVERLEASGLTPWLISGDASQPVNRVADQVGISLDHTFSRQSPEAKEQRVKANKHSLMVGDGINDAIALAAAEVGVAVASGMQTSLEAADIYLTRSGVQGVVDLIVLANQTKRIRKACLALSLSYNALGIVGASLGYVTPLFAAVLMPISSATVIALATLGLRRGRS